MKKKISKLSNSLITKFILMNSVVFLILISTSFMILYSSQHIKKMLDKTVTKEFSIVLKNGEMSRKLSRIVSRTTILESTFFGNKELLKDEKSELIKQITDLEKETKNPQVKINLDNFKQKLLICLEQYSELNTLNYKIESAQSQLETTMFSLEKVISDKMIDQVLQGENSSILEQLSILTVGYQETLHKINILYTKLCLSHFNSSCTEYETQILDLMDNLLLRIRTLNASEPEISKYAYLIQTNLETYQEYLIEFTNIANELQPQMDEVNLEKENIFSLLEKIDSEFLDSAENMRENASIIIGRASKFVFLLSFVIIVLLTIFSLKFIQTNFVYPMKTIIRRIKSIGSGDLNFKKELKRKDEWSLIEDAINDMASNRKQAETDLQAAIQQLQANEQQLKASNQQLMANEEMLIVSEEKYRKLISTSAEGFWMIDAEAKTIDVNDALCKILGVEREEIIGKTPFDFVDEENSKIFKKQIFKSNTTEQRFYEITLKDKNGNSIQTLFNATSQFDSKGNRSGSFAFITDVSKLKQTEEKLKSIMRSMDDMVFVLDKNNTFIDVNTHNNNNLYLDPDNFIGKKHSEIIPKHIDDLYNKAIVNVKKGKTEEYEYTLKVADEIHWFALKISPILKDNKFDGSVSVVRDITIRKQIEEQIKKDLKIKTALIQEIYHRTKNNMAVITAMLSMESRRSNNEFVNSTFKEIINKIKSMALVHQKLYKAKDLSNINLREYVEDLLALIIQSYDLLSKKIQINYDLQDINILFDSAIPLGLIISELISNIFKHAFPKNQEGEIFIRLYIEDDKTINLEIIDNGVGFPDNFDPRKDGSMGLVSVFSIAENQLKGEISVKSENGLKWHIRIKDDKKKERV